MRACACLRVCAVRGATGPQGRRAHAGFDAVRVRWRVWGALRVDATHFDALVGLAECRVEIGKTFASISDPPDGTRRALDEFRAGWLLYRRALELAGAGGAGNGAHVSGSDPGSARDRLNVAYAAACAAHLAGESETCGEILANVLRCGGCAPATIAADEDLVGLRPGLWGGG